MGIIEEELAEFQQSDGHIVRIESNEGGEIHIHIGDLRIDMTPTEFQHFAEVVAKAQENLHEQKEWN